MFNKNLKYYRLKQNMSKKELASLIDVTPMTITNYESGKRKPSMPTLKKLAQVLGVRVTDFLERRNDHLIFEHGEFRKHGDFSLKQQEFIRASVEEYIGRFYNIVEILGEKVLPDSLPVHQLILSKDIENNALEMRKYLKLSESGPIGNLVELLENKGVIIYMCDIDNLGFSGMNGLVNGRPYIIVNQNMSPERIRSTIAHEMVHFIFKWNQDISEKELEETVNAISGAFLFPEEDVIRELGVRRTIVSNDMVLISKEYGISMYLLVKRAYVCHVITESVMKAFYSVAAAHGWKTNEPHRIIKESPTLFSQLVYRAIAENEITIQKGAELLKISFDEVSQRCFSLEL